MKDMSSDLFSCFTMLAKRQASYTKRGFKNSEERWYCSERFDMVDSGYYFVTFTQIEQLAKMGLIEYEEVGENKALSFRITPSGESYLTFWKI